MDDILKTLPSGSPDAAVKMFLDKIVEVNPKVQTGLIKDAFLFAWHAHKDQFRKSGEPFLAHPVATAFILAEQKLDAITIAAGLLHDVLEDTSTTKEELSELFGEEVALLVDGVTKIRALQMRNRQERQAETYRKMLLSMAKDLRVIIIKFADRIHNLRTLKYLEPERIRAIAEETLDIYAPLAHRLGMAKIKLDLEDLAFKHLHPQEYKDIAAKVAEYHFDRETAIDNFASPLRATLEEDKITAVIAGRPKHFYSIYRKMVQRNKPFEEIFDLLAIRIIVNSIRDCYHVLGQIHSMWTPIQDRFKDYISTPKSNGYQSLHTTIFGEHNKIIEMQIRTWEMNEIAEDGVAAHWLYKSSDQVRSFSKEDKTLSWLRNLIEWQKDLTDSAEFYEFFKIDLFHAEIFVFTPRGDLIPLPSGATVLDFAFAVHTQLGLHCTGAKIDSKIEPINATLKNGQTIEVLHSDSKTPSIEWLKDAKTPKARGAIRRWLKNAEKQESVDLGKKIIQTSYKRLHANSSFNEHVPEVLKFLGLSSIERLYELAGTGELPVSRVMQYFHASKIKKKMSSNMVSRLVGTFTGRTQGILVGSSNDNLMVRFAKCCNPIPGDPIIGFVTKGRGISVHRCDCRTSEIFDTDGERKIEVSWDQGEQKKFYVSLELTGTDRPGMLFEISHVLCDSGANVTDAMIKVTNQQARGAFQIEIHDRNQLKQILRRIQKIKGIENVARVKDYITYPGDNTA
ncbi:MAG: bifunctional (p)ppGpp synthetase/guanosine-3',5'-bis(diphosphate) 3'-pyrophosphohydrolase [Chitinispirillales bacterium]|jgi:GTP pyrophosphokinase|nr:bifunctional (p)ppGpp synthetase/guanosine-3',5'-bis(diphosphate) 3'-pyrophosphohydrolase [Chitinispirillales bacterium]